MKGTDLFEIRVTGPQNFLIQGGDVELWADGIDGISIKEAKCVVNPEKSPFIPGGNPAEFVRDKIVGEIDDEFRRMKEIISDSSNPLRRVEVM